jgi:hypothetical protein
MVSTLPRAACALALFAAPVLACLLASDTRLLSAGSTDGGESLIAVDAADLPRDLLDQLSPYLEGQESFVLFAAGPKDKGKADKGKADKGKADKGKADKGKADKGKADKGKADKAISTIVQIDLRKLPPDLAAQLLRYALKDSEPKGKIEKGRAESKTREEGKKGKGKKA